jgi:iron complex outermembrane receptor protein
MTAAGTAKLRPGGQLYYADAFFNRRLGLVLNLGRSDLYEETGRMTHNYNYTATAADARPQVMNTIAFMSAPRIYERNSASLAVDFRATPNLSLGVNLNWFNSALWTPQRTFTFTTGTRTAVTGDGVTDITSATNSSIAFTSIAGVNKLGKSMTVSPNFQWKLGHLTLDGRLAVTNADSWYAPQDQGVFYNPGTMTLANTRFTATRSSVMSPDWKIAQISGNDISNPATWPTTGTFQIADGRSASQKFYTGKLDATLPTTIAGIPVEWQAGYKYSYEGRAYDDTGVLERYTYAGPANPGFWADKVSEFAFNDTYLGGRITSISGGRIFMPSAAALHRDFLANPAHYRPVAATAANAYAVWVTNHTRYGEEINAGYVMATAKPGRELSLRAGLRYEKTTNIAIEPDSYTTEQMRAAGYAVTASTGLATTVDGIYRQFMSRPWVERRTSYDNLFPSASFKYQLPGNTDLSGGVSTTIRRAPYSNLSGQYIVNDENLTVTATNPNLEPENARNFALRLAHYTRSLGMYSVSVFERQIDSMFITDSLTAREFGNTDPRYDNYTFSTTVNSAGQQTMRSLELQFSQNLGFLNKHLRRFTLTGAYTRNYLRHTTVEGLMPEIINGGFNFTYWRVNLYANGSRTGDRWNSLANGRIDKGRLYVSAGGNIRLARNLRLSLSIRNLTDTPEFNRVETRPGQPPVVQLYQSNGTTYTLQLKANF